MRVRSGSVFLRMEKNIIFQVEDNGIGMTEEQCREILRKEPGDRTGIGIKNVMIGSRFILEAIMD